MNILLFIFAILPEILAAPLASNSLILSRMPVAPAPPNYQAAVLEEWIPSGTTYSISQNWTTGCTNLPTDGKLQPDWFYGFNAWMLCRALPPGSSTSVRPANTVVGRLSEAGVWSQVSNLGSTFVNGSSLHSLVMPALDLAYIIGGGVPPQPNYLTIAIISTAQILGTINSTNNMFETVLYNNSVVVLANPPPPVSGGGTTAPAVITNSIDLSNIDAIYPKPTGWSIVNALSIPETQQVVWFMISSPKPSIVRFNISAPLLNETFGPPPKAGAGAIQFTLLSGRYEQAGFTVYLGNGSHIVSNTIVGLRTKAGYKIIAHAPPGWNYNSMIARYLISPSSPTPVATATITASSTVSITPSVSLSGTPGSSVSPTVSVTPGSSVSPTVSVTPGSSVSPTVSLTPSVSVSPTVSTTPGSSLSPTVSLTPSTSVSSTVSVTATISTTPTPSVTQTPSQTPTQTPSQTPSQTSTQTPSQTPSQTSTSSTTPTASITPTPTPTTTHTLSITSTPTPTSTISSSGTPTPSILPLENALSASQSGNSPSSPNSIVGIAIGSCFVGMALVGLYITFRRKNKRRSMPVSNWGPHGKIHANRITGPTTEISHNPSMQQWRQSSNPSLTQAPSFRKIEPVHTKKTFEPVIIN